MCKVRQADDSSANLLEQVEEVVRRVIHDENARLLRESSLKPLLTFRDLCRTLRISERTGETMLAADELPPPLWMRGKRMWHPDTVTAFLRTLDRR